jgi:hypothetical protein
LRPRALHGLAVTLSLVTVLAGATPARAQSAEDKAAADAAFDQGKRLMAAHSYAEACQKLSESLRRDPGVGTMLGLADCFEKNGQNASAWAQFREAAAVAARKSDPREKVARENVERIAPTLSKLTVQVPHEADVRGLEVKRDGVDLGRAIWGVDVPLDPGVHTVIASAPGRKEWQASVTIAPVAGTQSITIPVLEEAPVALETPGGSPAAGSARDGSSASDAGTSPASRADMGRTQRYVGIGVAIGAVLGLGAKSKLDASNADGHCAPAGDCDATGLSLRSDAKGAALGSTIGFVVGAAAIAGGAVLYFSAPHPSRATGGATEPSGASRASGPRVGVSVLPHRDGAAAALVGSW